MGKGEKSRFASLFGFNQQQNAGGGRQPEEAAAERPPQQRYYQGTRVRPREDDDYNNYYYGRYGYGDRDIDKKATEFIERVHRGMLAKDQDG